MNKKKIMSRGLVSLLAVLFALLPVQVTLCQAAESTVVSLPVGGSLADGNTEKKKVVRTSKDAFDEAEKSEDDEESSISTGMWIGIGVGAAGLIGVAVAVGGGGGGGGDEPPAPIVPPTAAQIVDAWAAAGNQPGSGRTYTGTYHLYDGGSLGYDLQVSSGEHLVGSGSWRITGYQLDIHTDHGSLYSGSFVPGNINTINMNANTGWNLTLNRI